MGLFDNQKIAVAFCSPHRKITLPNGQRINDTVTVDWHRRRMALSVGTNANFIEFFADGYEVGDARDQVARRCLDHKPQPTYLFFYDDDILPEWDAFVKLFYRLQTMPQYDIAAGVYACKTIGDPLIYAGDGCGPFWDWTIGDLLTTEGHGITGTHMGLTLIRVSLFQRMLDAGAATDQIPFFKTINEQWRASNGCLQTRTGTEDLYFYQLARQVGVKIVVDTSVLAGHIDKNTGITWGLPEHSPPVQRAKWMGGKDTADGVECTTCKGTKKIGENECGSCSGTGTIKATPKLALDLGAGGTRREWPGHKTYTTDLRADSKPDYVQDSRWLNLPENHFDLVASSHHLEHIPRWEQEKVWAEVFRVCKPGGSIEHTVPSIEWAAAKIADGQTDEHVMNVLYGAQEAHGYERMLNCHFFGYTKAVSKALAEASGFVDVTCEDWRDRPELGYNLIIRGKKPVPVSAEVVPPIANEIPASETTATGGAA